MTARTRRPFRARAPLAIGSMLAAAFVAACGWDPSRPFDREAPQVNEAIRAYDAGEAGAAADLLEEYLATGGCSDGNIGTPLRIRERSNGTFDLGLTLFSIAERFGRRFGDEEVDAGDLDPKLQGLRAGHVDCALRVVRAIAEDRSQPVALRARARYLEGNLLFLTAAYQEAVTAYDHALELVPAMGDAGPIGVSPDAGAVYAPDVLGRDAAWNRAVALRRIEDKKDAGPDAAPPDGGGDGGKSDDQSDGGSDDKNKDAGSDDKNKDAGSKDDKNKDAGKDSGGGEQNQPPPEKKPEEDQKPPPPSRQSQDERILDQLENAPTVQQETAKHQGKGRKVRGMADEMIRLVGILTMLLGFVWSGLAFAQGVDVSGSVDEHEIELGDTVTYTLQATSTTSESPGDPSLASPQGFTLVDSRPSRSNSVSWVNGRTTEKHSLTATWTLRSDRLGTFMIGPATVTIGGAKKTAPAARVVVVAPGQGKPKPRRPTQQRPFDPWGGASPLDPFKGIFPPTDEDFPDPSGGVATDPKLSLDRERGSGAFLHATVDKTRAVIGEQVTLSVYLYEDLHGRGVNPTDVHEATANDFVKRSLLQDETRATYVGNALVGGRPWAVKLVRKSALFPIKSGRLGIGPMTLTLAQTRNGLRESESLFVDVSEPPVANRPAGYQVGDTGEFSLSSTTSPKSIDQHGAVGVTVELRGSGNFPASLPTPEISGVEWLEPQTRDSLGPVANDRFGGTRTFSYVVRVHNAGAVDLGEIRLPYFDPQTRSYKVARTALGIVSVSKADARDAGPDVTEPVLGNLPGPRTALEGAHEETFWTERPLFWVLLFGAPLACVFALTMGRAVRHLREQRRAAAPSPERVARDRRAEAEAALEKDDGKAAVAAIGRALEAEILASTGVNVRGTSTAGAAAELVNAGIPETTARSVTTVLAECDNARFAPEGVTIEAARSLWKRARDAAAAARSRAEGAA